MFCALAVYACQYQGNQERQKEVFQGEVDYQQDTTETLQTASSCAWLDLNNTRAYKSEKEKRIMEPDKGEEKETLVKKTARGNYIAV